MTGKPAARQGDMTAVGGPIVQGSAGVFIGAPTGVACSVCPGGMTSGHPVNPLLGAKVLPGETDIALPGPLPFVLSRSYSSYQTKTPSPAGMFGPGWKVAGDIHLQIRDTELILNDNSGRSIHFDPLLPGEIAFSRSESFWLARGGISALPDIHPLAPLWKGLTEALRLSPDIYLVADSAQGPWWVLGWCERIPGPDEALPAPLPPHRVLTCLADGYGRTLTFHRDGDGEFAGHISAVTDGAGRRFRLVLQRLTDVVQTRYGADDGVRLTAVWPEYDPLYPQALPASPLVRYDYSARGELTAVYDRGGVQVRRFAYDDRHPGRMVAHQYAGRPVTTYRYDAAGRVTEQHNPEGLSYTYDYEKDRITVTDSLARRSVLQTCGEGGLKRVVREARADGSVILSEFDPFGRLTAQTDAAGRWTRYRLNPASGHVDTLYTPDGRETLFFRNRQRQLTMTAFPDGLKSHRAYDEKGRLTEETSRDGIVTRRLYADPLSDLPSAMEDATGRRTLRHTPYGQLQTYTDCSGNTTRYDYDRFGQLTAVHREEGLSLYQVFDNRGRLLSRRNGEHVTRYEYNEAGDLTVTVHPDGSRSSTEYDAWGNVVAAEQGGLTRRMTYDPAGRVTELINENGATSTFTYDALDRLIQETGFDGRTQRFAYDLRGKLIRSEEAGLVTLWHYDEADRLSHRTVNGLPAEQWQYDARGWLTSLTHSSEGHQVAIHYGYDDLGRLISERQSVHAPDSGTLLWEHLTQHSYADTGLAYRLTGDCLPPVEWLTYGPGHLAGVKLGDTPLAEFTRDRLHREVQRTFGAYVLDTAYTPEGQILSHQASDPQLSRDYGYNRRGEMVRLTGAQHENMYDYDAAGRLSGVRTKMAGQGRTACWFTDPAGNRITGGAPSEQSPVAWPDNRLLRNPQWQYQYDSHGRLTQKTAVSGSADHHYDYDHQHRLVRYRCGQTETRYLYDPLGRRVAKQTGRDTLWYGWQGDRLTTTQTAISRIQTVYLPGSFTPLLRVETAAAELQTARRRTLAEKFQQAANVTFPPELITQVDNLEAGLRRGELSEHNRQWLVQSGLTVEQLVSQLEPEHRPERSIHLYHCDHRGLPLALIDTRGRTVWSAEYDEWGNVLREHNPEGMQQLLRLPGQQQDEESGLYYNRHRYYDPAQGRYITQDPIGLRGGWNLYTYPLDPVGNSDPLGLSGLGAWLGQPGMKDAYNHAAAEYERSIQPASEWKFTGWEVKDGPEWAFWSKSKSVGAMCEDQYANKKTVSYLYFQLGPFDINEKSPNSFSPDGLETNSPSVSEAIIGISEAHTQAKKCGSLNGFQCFMQNDANPELGNRLCKG
ncbi:RHS repeat-associated core domain-containing protein [Trabulsiella odontotermitis]|uniref:RHS repeat-associated core domain-containing protein n=1 Tax=Trabulsiella odontotermitis TaxID=379893 RepID=UPI0006766F35|nr:RHS repeat-associated core domain-containing protein [Trabulsiella odontotermitis]